MTEAIPETLYVAVGPVDPSFEFPGTPPVATMARWIAPDTPGAASPADGGEFVQVGGAGAVYEWDGSSEFDPESGVARSGLDALAPGEQVLRDAVVEALVVQGLQNLGDPPPTGGL